MAAAFARLAAHPGSIAWLDAGPETSGSQPATLTHAVLRSAAAPRRSYLIIPASDEHRLSANVATGTVRRLRAGREQTEPGTVFAALRSSWQPGATAETQPRFAGGWVGWLGYECAATTLGIELKTEGEQYPDSAWFAAGAWARLDHDTGTLEFAGDDRDAMQRLREAFAESDHGTNTHATPTNAAHVATASWREGEAEYAARIAAAQRFIADGDAYQLCLTSRVSGERLPEPSEQLYLRLRLASPSHHGSYLRIADTSVLSSSPEQFLELRPDRRMRSTPIKGTRPRASAPGQDARLAAELQQSEKERAENVMIVDLMRNDFGRVALPGTVSVPRLLEVESYRPVHQLVSTVQAQLAPGRHPMDAIEAVFPAGSMTGAPKRRAVQLLQQLESGPRGIYSGVTGYLSNDGSVDLAMNIRCIVARPAGWTVGAGGGITALSVPSEEVAESRLKAQLLLELLGVAESTPAS